ncbi:hypothetical protein D6J61_25750 [Salmonella enterica subsp. enterica serovar Alachua]|nr:hypothetical protein [Salmonella enterica subsp. enterica serovar Alachua]
MANELKPCICGKTPRIERKKGLAGITKVPFYREQIVCRCGVSSKLFKSPDQALTAWNTRPAAPVEGLERYRVEAYENTHYENGHTHSEGWDVAAIEDPEGDYVLFSQAEAIIAAERAENKRAKDDLTRVLVHFVREHFPKNTTFKPFDDLLGLITQFDNASTIAREYVSRIRSLEADNAALTARVKELGDELEHSDRVKGVNTQYANALAYLEMTEDDDPEEFAKRLWDEREALETGAVQMHQDMKALETQLAAAKKVRKAAEKVVWFDWSDNDDDAVKAVSDLRAALEGRP